METYTAAAWASDEYIREKVNEAREGVTSINIPDGVETPALAEIDGLARAIEFYARGGLIAGAPVNADEFYDRVQRVHAAVDKIPFPIGRVVITRGAYRVLCAPSTEENPWPEPGIENKLDGPGENRYAPEQLDTGGESVLNAILTRYMAGDWGNTIPEDRPANDHAIKIGERIFAVYRVGEDSLYVITEWDRSTTSVIHSNEY